MKLLLTILFVGLVAGIPTIPKGPDDDDSNDDIPTVKVSVVLNSDKVLEIQKGVVKPYVAYAAFKNSMNTTG